MGWRGTVRTIQAASRRHARDVARRERYNEQLQRHAQKLSDLQAAKAEAEDLVTLIKQLTTVHTDASEWIDWKKLAEAPAPVKPVLNHHEEEKAKRAFDNFRPSLITKVIGRTEKVRKRLQSKIEDGRQADAQKLQDALIKFDWDLAEWNEEVAFANRVLSGDRKAWFEAIEELKPFEELDGLGSEVEVKFEGDLVIVDFRVQSDSVIPKERISVLKSGKISRKNFSKSEFNGLYQDYVCSCILRIAREIIALLPVDSVVVSAVDDLLNSATGHVEEQIIASLLAKRATINKLNFEQIDPSDAFKNFIHNMNFKATSGFLPSSRVSVPENSSQVASAK